MSSDERQVGQVFEGFQILEQLPVHWPGRMYLAKPTDPTQHTHKEAFLYHITPGDLPRYTSEQWQRLQLRLPALLVLSHPNISRYTRCLGPTDNELWLVSPTQAPPSPQLPRYLNGLLALQNPGKLRPGNALHTYRQLKDALAHLHAQQLFHGALCLEAIGLDWQEKPPKAILLGAGLNIPRPSPHQAPAHIEPLLRTPATTDSIEDGQQRDKRALGTMLWRIVTAEWPPQEPAFSQPQSTPWAWPLTEPPPPELCEAWRECFQQTETTAASLAQAIETLSHNNKTLAYAPNAPTGQPTKQAQRWANDVGNTLPYEEELGQQMAQLEAMARESTANATPPGTPTPSMLAALEIPEPIPEVWEREAMRIDAKLDRQRSQSAPPFLLWAALLFCLFVGWLYRSGCTS